MTDREQGRWCVVQRARLRVRRWDDEVVVYDDRSGDTHILDDACGQVLERLLRGGAWDDELEPLCIRRGTDPGPAPGRLYDVLQRLRRLGLVKPLRK